MAENGIELAKSYTGILDEVYQRASVSGCLASIRRMVRQGAHAKEILIPRIEVSGLGDYVRNQGYATGAIEFSYETHVPTYERGLHLVADMCRCFGRNPKRMQKCFISLHHEDYFLWCPKLGIEMPDGTIASAARGITNVLSYDGKTLYSITEGRASDADGILRATFVRGKDELGRAAYRFIGVFKNDGPKPDDERYGVHNIMSDTIDLSPWN